MKTVLRSWLRGKFFGTMHRALYHDVGRAACVSSIRGLMSPRVRMPERRLFAEPSPYDELSFEPKKQVAARNSRPVFVTGRFRSGTTLLWNVFRSISNCTAYYEPFNERRWFDPNCRGTRVDVTHLGVSDYWREYEGFESLGDLYDDAWTYRDLYMDEDSWNSEMTRYIALLVDNSKAQPILKFNRIDFRLKWLRHNFPTAKIVHIYRNPRDQWLSTMLQKPQFPSNGNIRDYADYDEFYLLSWARDLSYHFPFLAESEVSHPYQLFYYIWRLSFLFGRKDADISLRYEDLVESPERQLANLFEQIEIAVPNLHAVSSLCERRSSGKWKKYASDEWFARHEDGCETVLDAFISRHAANENLSRRDYFQRQPSLVH